MTLFDEGKVVILVGCTEFASKEENPNVPYTPEEIAADAAACAEAGAAMVHWHSRYENGDQAIEDDSAGASIYRRAMELAAQRTDVIMVPTGHYRGGDPTKSSDLPPVFALVNDPPKGIPLEVAPLDGFRFARDLPPYPLTYPTIDPATGAMFASPTEKWGDQYLTEEATSAPAPSSGPRPYVAPEVLREMVAAGVVPNFCFYDLAQVRLAYHWCRTGIAPQPAMTQMMVWGNRIWGPSAKPSGLDSYLSEWPNDVDAEHFLMAVSMPHVESHDLLVEAGLDRRMNIRVGIGDNPTIFKDWTNADLVRSLVERLERRGLVPATPAEVRARLGLAAQATVARA